MNGLYVVTTFMLVNLHPVVWQRISLVRTLKHENHLVITRNRANTFFFVMEAADGAC